MPNLKDIIDVAQALESKAVRVVADRCVVVRNRNASCRRCVKACPADAITVRGNDLTLDNHACVSCGACTVVCPVEALVPLDPTDADLAAGAARSASALDGTAVIACARMAAKDVGDPSKYAMVPCMARVDEVLLVELAAAGIERVVLVDGTCRTCKYRDTSAGVDEAVAQAQALIAAQGGSAIIERASEFPAQAVLEDKASLYGQERRGFFTRSTKRAREASVKTAEVMVFKEFEQRMPSLRERLGVTASGAMPWLTAQRRERLMDSLDQIGTPVQDTVSSRQFATVSIDEEKCSACGMCAVFCPTGALKKSDEKPEDGVGSYLEFQAFDCVNCRVCADVCMKKCLKTSTEVSTEELFDFEPRLIHLPDPPKRTGMLTGFKRQ
ncbi:MAG TPA: 4Fe-4S binding protein [Candidatus Aphodovivens excrementavium]|nr:4Fe-4S binding protein [Candidatus Aphodovivens excrementavium]